MLNMILLQERLSAFIQLGKTLSYFNTEQKWTSFECGLSEEEFNQFNNVIKNVYQTNGWFTETNVRYALSSISSMLEEEKLNQWITPYTFNELKPKKVAVIMAGNIPLVGFHDFLSILISGHKVLIKLSSNDQILFPKVIEILLKIDPRFKEDIAVVQKLTDFDAVIATGSNNSAVYFETYFGKYPHIIRKNRTSIAILDGTESPEELKKLSNDIFQYFGLGCRNITKIYIPLSYNLDLLFAAFYDWKDIIHHNKYANNYDYNKAIYLMNKENLVENGFLLLKQDEGLHSPLGVLFYEEYKTLSELNIKLEGYRDELQCIVSKTEIPFGKSQEPELWDYADHIDTLKFLKAL